jgi:hypothetical protein
VNVDDLVIRDEARKSVVTLERDCDGNVVALHVEFDSPRPITDFVRYDAAFQVFPHRAPAPPAGQESRARAVTEEGRTPCGGR